MTWDDMMITLYSCFLFKEIHLSLLHLMMVMTLHNLTRFPSCWHFWNNKKIIDVMITTTRYLQLTHGPNKYLMCEFSLLQVLWRRSCARTPLLSFTVHMKVSLTSSLLSSDGRVMTSVHTWMDQEEVLHSSQIQQLQMQRQIKMLLLVFICSYLPVFIFWLASVNQIKSEIIK